jgi:hypothetical protein
MSPQTKPGRSGDARPIVYETAMSKRKRKLKAESSRELRPLPMPVKRPVGYPVSLAATELEELKDQFHKELGALVSKKLPVEVTLGDPVRRRDGKGDATRTGDHARSAHPACQAVARAPIDRHSVGDVTLPDAVWWRAPI